MCLVLSCVASAKEDATPSFDSDVSSGSVSGPRISDSREGQQLWEQAQRRQAQEQLAQRMNRALRPYGLSLSELTLNPQSHRVGGGECGQFYCPPEWAGYYAWNQKVVCHILIGEYVYKTPQDQAECDPHTP